MLQYSKKAFEETYKSQNVLYRLMCDIIQPKKTFSRLPQSIFSVHTYQAVLILIVQNTAKHVSVLWALHLIQSDENRSLCKYSFKWFERYITLFIPDLHSIDSLYKYCYRGCNTFKIWNKALMFCNSPKKLQIFLTGLFLGIDRCNSFLLFLYLRCGHIRQELWRERVIRLCKNIMFTESVQLIISQPLGNILQMLFVTLLIVAENLKIINIKIILNVFIKTRITSFINVWSTVGSLHVTVGMERYWNCTVFCNKSDLFNIFRFCRSFVK